VVEGVNGFCSGLSAGEIGEGIVKILCNSNIDDRKCVTLAETYDWNRIVEALEQRYSAIV
jgi:hypothetical protein